MPAKRHYPGRARGSTRGRSEGLCNGAEPPGTWSQPCWQHPRRKCHPADPPGTTSGYWSSQAASPFAIGQGISATTHIILGANQESFSASGTVSGYQSANYLDNYMVYRRNYEISDDPNNSKEIIGRPAYKSLELQGTHGYVQTIGANILTGFSGATATEQELELIDQLLDGGVYVG